MKFNNKYQVLGSKVKFGKNVRIGDNTIIYDNTIIGNDTIIANDCVIGEPSSDYYYNENYTNKTTQIGDNCLIRSHAIIYNGNSIGNNLSTGHRIMLRENNNIGNNCKIGNYTELHGHVRIGNYSNLHSSVCIVENANIGNFVWIAPGTILTNDITPPSNNRKSPIVDDYTFIAVNCVILPGVRIGKHCLIGASTLVTKDVEDYSVCLGTPGKFIKDIRDIEIKNIKHYPWPNNFEQGMPWEGIGYENWIKTQNND
ncbi:MAG TPA: N-acetyltransferase [Bacteroidales bacterium]|nr:N-acetyltransferase [Bacteroidales bacterium]